jgi:hypothetical protein
LVLLSAAMLIGQGRVVRDKLPVNQAAEPPEINDDGEKEPEFEDSLELVGAQTGETRFPGETEFLTQQPGEGE